MSQGAICTESKFSTLVRIDQAHEIDACVIESCHGMILKHSLYRRRKGIHNGPDHCKLLYVSTPLQASICSDLSDSAHLRGADDFLDSTLLSLPLLLEQPPQLGTQRAALGVVPAPQLGEPGADGLHILAAVLRQCAVVRLQNLCLQALGQNLQSHRACSVNDALVICLVCTPSFYRLKYQTAMTSGQDLDSHWARDPRCEGSLYALCDLPLEMGYCDDIMADTWRESNE